MFVLGLMVLIATYMRDQMLTPLRSKLSSSTAKSVLSSVEYAFNTLDEIFFFGSVGFGIVALLLAYMTPARPAFLFLAIISFAIALLVIPQFANIFQDFSEKPQFASFMTNCPGGENCDYPMTYTIFKNYGLFFWMFGFLILVILFAKLRMGSGDV